MGFYADYQPDGNHLCAQLSSVRSCTDVSIVCHFLRFAHGMDVHCDNCVFILYDSLRIHTPRGKFHVDRHTRSL
mgnify:CR=1 FL=1